MSDVRVMCDQETFSRGYDYNESHSTVIDAVKKVSDDVMQIIATTTGSEIYKQTINVYNRSDAIKILGQCSCYVGINCKHIISAALAHLDEVADLEIEKKPISSSSKVDTWMKELEEAQSDEEETFATSTVLLYELRLSKSMVDVTLTLYTARVLKSGGYGKVNKARPNAIFSAFSTPDYFRESDKEAIPYLKALGGGKDVTATLRGKLGALLLEAAVATGRCYWQRSHTKNVTMASTRFLQTVWKDVDGFSSRLGFDLGTDTFMVNSEPAFYCDSKSKTIGRVESEFNAKELALLRNAPSVDNEEQDDFVSKMQKKLPHIELPQHHDTRIVEGLTPTAVITFYANNSEHRVKLSFIYGDVELDALPLRLSTLLQTKESVRVIRAQELEKEFIETLVNYQFSISQKHFIPDTALSVHEKIEAWEKLVNSKEDLEKEGFIVRQEDSFVYTFEEITEVDVSVESESHWFDVSIHINLNGQKIPLLPVISQLLQERLPVEDLPQQMHFALSDTQFIKLDVATFKPILSMVYELFDTQEGTESLQLTTYDAKSLAHLSEGQFNFMDSTKLTEISSKLKSLDTLAHVDAPKGLQAELRDYQMDGLAWLDFLREYQFGGILADDMGLGKTIQTLSHILREKEAGRLSGPVIVVAPTSLLGSWKKEAGIFTPDLNVAISHGPNRKKVLAELESLDIIITTYTLITNDIEIFKKQKFYYLILDEAQKIKNSRSQATQSIKKIKSEHYLALTGTPMENHLGELWSIFDVVAQGLLGSEKLFKSMYQNPIEKEHDANVQAMLNSRIQAFMMRRTKENVAKELPAKTEILRSIPFENEQATLYETIRVTMEKKVRDTIKEMGIGKSHITILDALLKLRQVCCDPRLLSMDQAKNIEQSAKLTALMDLVVEMVEEGRKILIFSQFTSMLELIEDAFNKEALSYVKLTGSTTKRQEVIDKFQNGEVDIFLISLKAGGVGLNLTNADTVIHYDPWWNPAAEDQATDRAYRIGQDKPVFVYKLVIEDSVEEKIVAMQESKRGLAENLYEGANQGMKSVDSEALLGLFEKSK
jgi:SNF2 family DNA or RNA helicase